MGPPPASRVCCVVAILATRRPFAARRIAVSTGRRTATTSLVSAWRRGKKAADELRERGVGQLTRVFHGLGRAGIVRITEARSAGGAESRRLRRLRFGLRLDGESSGLAQPSECRRAYGPSKPEAQARKPLMNDAAAHEFAKPAWNSGVEFRRASMHIPRLRFGLGFASGLDSLRAWMRLCDSRLQYPG